MRTITVTVVADFRDSREAETMRDAIMTAAERGLEIRQIKGLVSAWMAPEEKP